MTKYQSEYGSHPGKREISKRRDRARSFYHIDPKKRQENLRKERKSNKHKRRGW